MRRQPLVLAALALSIGLPAEARAETSCELDRAAQDKVVTVRGKIKSIDVDRGDKSYWVVVELRDQCGIAEVNVSTKQSPRCRAGATVSVTGPYKGAGERLIEAQRVVCLK
jgi:hypothetical protein